MPKYSEEDFQRVSRQAGFGVVNFDQGPTSVELAAEPPRQPRRHLEHDVQVQFINWCKENKWRAPELGWYFAVPNGGKRHPAVAAMLKQEGVQAGVPDILFLIPRYPYNFLGIELKIKGNDPSEDQEKWHKFLARQGGKIVVAYGLDEIQEATREYFNLDF